MMNWLLSAAAFLSCGCCSYWQEIPEYLHVRRSTSLAGMRLACLVCFSISVTSAAFNAAQYPRSQQLHSNVKIFWNIDSTLKTLNLAIQATASGWVGFGIAEAGGMQGADIVYYEAAANRLVDAYSLDFTTPSVDTHQDWTLVSSRLDGGVITVEMVRALDTNDPQDTKLVDDSWPAVDGTRFITAFGNTPTIQYHGASNRALGQVRFFTPPSTDPLQAIKSNTSVKNITILQQNFSIPVRTTTYHHLCVPLSTKYGGSINVTDKQHMVAIEFIADPLAQQNVHHLTVQCFSNGSPPTFDVQDAPEYFPPSYSGTMCVGESGPQIWAWAKGFTYLTMPEGTGVPIMGSSGCDYILLQYHYDNAAHTPGRLDNSGIAIHYTAPRAVEVGVLQVGDPTVELYGVPLSRGLVKASFSCVGITDNFDVPAVTVFYRGFHLHKHGQRMVTRQYRGSNLLRMDSVEFWNTDLGGIYNPTSTGRGFEVRKGDSFRVDCYYKVDGNVIWGLGSENEMCIDFIYYYPLQASMGSGLCKVAGNQRRGDISNGSFMGETCAPVTMSTRAALGGCLGDRRLAADVQIASSFGPCSNVTSSLPDICNLGSAPPASTTRGAPVTSTTTTPAASGTATSSTPKITAGVGATLCPWPGFKLVGVAILVATLVAMCAL